MFINRLNWPPIDWKERIARVGRANASRITGISENSLKNYQRGTQPCYRNGLLLEQMCDGKPPCKVQVDWERLFQDIQNVALSSYQIARDTAIPQSTLMSCKAGSEPRFSDGEILVDYYRAVLGKRPDEVPLLQHERLSGEQQP